MVRMTWATSKGWEQRVAAASFVVVLMLGGLSAFTNNGVYEARPDQLAWSLLVIAATIVFRGLVTGQGLSRRQRIAAGVLLSLSVLTKQPTLVPCLLVCVLTLVAPATKPNDAAIASGVRRFDAVLTPLVFVGLSAIVGIGLQLASHGWADDFLLRQAFHQPRYLTLAQEIPWSLRRASVPLISFIIVTVCAAGSFVVRRRELVRRELFVVVAAFVFAVCPIPTSIAAAIKIGGNFNQLIGPLWTMTLGSCVLLMLMRRSGRSLLASAVACSVLVVGLGVLPRSVLDERIGKPALDQRNRWVSMDPFLYAAVDRGEVVYDWNAPSLSVSPRAPGHPAGDFIDRFVAGYTPRYFIRDLLEGRYALVGAFPMTQVYQDYWSGEGRYDASVAWKLNLLLDLGYAQVRDPNTGTYYFRPTSKLSQLGWFEQCFGPWAANDAGVGARVRGAGGLVCASKGQLTLGQAPATSTTLVLTLREGAGDATLRLAAPPTVLRLTPLNDRDEVAGAAASTSLVRGCLGSGEDDRDELTLRAVSGNGAWACTTGDDGPVLEIPVAKGATAHVALDIAAADVPAIKATTPDGTAVPFVISNAKAG
jgi:hypothetical protein